MVLIDCCTSSKLGREVTSNALVHYSKEDLGFIVEELVGDAGRTVMIHHGNGTGKPFMA